MLHSKVYLMEMADGTSAAFIGSHNMTGFALLGLNGEAGVLLEGPSQDTQFVAIRQHIATAVAQATRYDPAMKDAYAWWTTQFVEGLRDKTRDTPDPDDAENRRTVVVIAARASAPLPQKGDIIYFEIQGALGRASGRLRPTSISTSSRRCRPPRRRRCTNSGRRALRSGARLSAWNRMAEVKSCVPTGTSTMRGTLS